MNVVYDGGEEIGVGYLFFVGTNVYVGCVGEDTCNLGKYGFQNLHTFVGLHVEAHGAFESLAVAGHINLGDNDYTAFFGISCNLAALFLCVEFTGETCH